MVKIKAIVKAKQRRVTLEIDESLVTDLKLLGGGFIGPGIRRVLEACKSIMKAEANKIRSNKSK